MELWRSGIHGALLGIRPGARPTSLNIFLICNIALVVLLFHIDLIAITDTIIATCRDAE